MKEDSTSVATMVSFNFRSSGYSKLSHQFCVNLTSDPADEGEGVASLQSLPMPSTLGNHPFVFCIQ